MNSLETILKSASLVGLLLSIHATVGTVTASDSSTRSAASDPLKHAESATTPIREATREDWAWYCAASDSIAKYRRIPLLDQSILSKKPKLKQVVALIRHGARTPAKYNPTCWGGYNQTWNCNVPQETFSSVNRPNAEQSDEQFGTAGMSTSLDFVKRYSAPMSRNAIPGNCQVGQLIEEGIKQHHTVGKLLAEAYFTEDATNGTSVWRDPLISYDAFLLGKSHNSIYFRSTDVQRTRLSGANLLSSLLVYAFNGKLPPQVIKASKPTLHTVDKETDFLIFRWSTPGAKRALQSKELMELRAKHKPLVDRLKKHIALQLHKKGTWAEPLFDCLMTTACDAARFATEMPNVFVNEPEFLQETFSAAAAENLFPFTFNNSETSKENAKMLITEIRARIAAVLKEEQLLPDELSQLDSPSPVPAEAIDTDQPVLSEKFSLFAVHDTTLIPFLASLGPHVFDNIWTPYASLITLEVYELQKEESSASRIGFRLIYNGEDITPRVAGCSHLCPITKFFEATDWVNDIRGALDIDERNSKGSILLTDEPAMDSSAGIDGIHGWIVGVDALKRDVLWLLKQAIIIAACFVIGVVIGRRWKRTPEKGVFIRSCCSPLSSTPTPLLSVCRY